MHRHYAERNVRLYCWFKVFFEPLFWGPILISAIIHLGHMSLEEVYFMEAVVLLGFIVLEVPSGALADLVGRAKTIQLGGIFHLLSICWFATMNSPLDAWVANILWMIGMSLCSGADTALLYDSLKEVGKEREFQRVQGSAIGNRFFIIACCSLVVGPMAEIDLRLPLLVSIPGVLVAVCLPFFFREPSQSERFSWQAQRDMMRISVLFVANHKKVKWIVGYSVLIGVIMKAWFFTYNPYFELVELDLAHYGVVFFVLNIIGWFSSRYGYRAEEKIGEHGMLTGMILLVAIPVFVMGTAVSVGAISMIFVQNFVRGYKEPFLNHFLNRHLDSKNRATVISIRSAVNGLAEFCGLTIFGVMLMTWSLPFCLQVLGVASLVLGLFLLRRYSKIFV